MKRRARIVVGNAYKSFAENDAVLTLEQFSSDLGSLKRSDVVVLGQGLSLTDRNDLLSSCSKAGLKIVGDEPRCPLGQTHKSAEENVLTTRPVHKQGARYQSSLLVGEQSDRLVDHVTGQHLNGMLLLEAVRQATIATIETYLLQGPDTQWSFSWTRCDTRFLSFAFPVPTEITLTLPQVEDLGTKKRLSMVVDSEVAQGGQLVCEVRNELTLIPRALTSKLEARRAQRVASMFVAAHESVGTDIPRPELRA